MGDVGVVGFSFGLVARRKPNKNIERAAYDEYQARSKRNPYYPYTPEPNICNIRIAHAVADVAQRYKAKKVVVQWEVARRLKAMGNQPDREVGLRTDDEYLSSRDVWDATKTEFEAAGITDVIPLAQQFLHLWLVKRMIRKDGFTVIDVQYTPIGYVTDPGNVQWWTKSALSLMLYSLLKPFERLAPKRRQSA
jgi:hypothetical protein